MSLYPDLDDVAAESPVATKELAELRARVKEMEEAGLALYYAGFWSCDREVDEAALWERLRNVLDLPMGTSPRRRQGGTVSRQDDAKWIELQLCCEKAESALAKTKEALEAADITIERMKEAVEEGDLDGYHGAVMLARGWLLTEARQAARVAEEER